MILSEESREFVDHLRLYLLTSGRNEAEVEEITEELEDHLLEAEQEGKSTEHITGKSPETYIKELAGEMPLDKKQIAGWIQGFILGIVAFLLLGDALEGELSYSLLELIGYPVIALLYLGAIISSFRYVSSKRPTKKKEFTFYAVISSGFMLLFMGLFFMDQMLSIPAVWTAGPTAEGVILVLSALTLAALSWKWKSFFLVFVALVYYVPPLLMEAAGVQADTSLMVEAFLPLGLILLYIVIHTFMEKRKQTT